MGSIQESKEEKEVVAEVPQEEAVLGFQLNKEFLEFAFEREVLRFTVKVGTNPGDNYLSIMHAVNVVFKDDDVEPNQERHYLIKCYPNHPERRKFLDLMNVFEKELFMYSDFFLQLKQMAKECGAKDVGLTLAPFHGGSVVVNPSKKYANSPWAHENFLIMTDMRKTSKYSMADRINGLDKEHTILVLRELAKFHALTWAYKVKNGLKYLSSKYSNFLDSFYNQDDMNEQFKPLMQQISDSTFKILGETLGEEHPAYGGLKRILDDWDLYGRLMKQFMDPEGRSEDVHEEILRVKPEEDREYNKDPWLTGTHGDCWINNMLFHYDAKSRPTDVILVDFQVVREVCPTIDLAYFLFSSVRAPVRNPHKEELLQTYHDEFVRCCDALKVEPYPGFSLSSLKRRFRRSEIFGLLVALPFLKIVLKPHGESEDLDKSEMKDAVEMFSEILVGGKGKNTRLNDEVTAAVLDMYENGVL